VIDRLCLDFLIGAQVTAGQGTDAICDSLLSLLDDGDIVIDGGNSHYRDTERRLAKMLPRGIHFVGMGISGGEEGALYGPSMMPGGLHYCCIWFALLSRRTLVTR